MWGDTPGMSKAVMLVTWSGSWYALGLSFSLAAGAVADWEGDAGTACQTRSISLCIPDCSAWAPF